MYGEQGVYVVDSVKQLLPLSFGDEHVKKLVNEASQSVTKYHLIIDESK